MEPAADVEMDGTGIAESNIKDQGIVAHDDAPQPPIQVSETPTEAPAPKNSLSRGSSAKSVPGHLTSSLSTGNLASSLAKSPYAESIGGSTTSVLRYKGKKWTPPPGKFNEPEAPLRFSNPGPGRYDPAVQHACLSTKPRVLACRFGSEDRFKYFGPELPLERTTSGMYGGLFVPQGGQSPGPCYLPNHSLTKSRSQEASLLSQRRAQGGLEHRLKAKLPGPGAYNPNDTNISTKKNWTPQGRFMADDRTRYLGDVDPASQQPQKSFSPGPMYNPVVAITQERPKTVAFGGRGPGTMVKPPSLKAETPGPGTYTPMAQAACLSSKRRVPAASFGAPTGPETLPIDSAYCFHGNVPVDMRFASVANLSPGPAYKPNHEPVQEASKRPVFGTDRRFRAM
mmetsp:Transcript_16549/g.35490  ORF Transcript_16549/g.35490 Transcript_16549/m.35490 type:complete len:397 (-) Transcript_16549:232-1422(-)